MDLIWLGVPYFACGLVSFRVCLRWMRRDLAYVDREVRQFVAIYGFFFCFLLWPIGFVVIAVATGHARRLGSRRAGDLLARVGSWGERRDDKRAGGDANGVR